MSKSIWSMCGMCSIRCPIRVEIEDERVTWIEGNPHLLDGALCAKGSAGIALNDDDQRPQGPLIRRGSRGSGRWDRVSWATALDYVAEKLKKIKETHGPEAIMMSCRGGPFVDIVKAFINGLGSPNFTDHDSTCGRNVHHASLSLYGLGREGFIYDIKNCKHLVLFGRNILASFRIAELNQTLDMLEAGGKLTYVDVRQTVTGSKATRFFQVRPGTDYALALGMIHEVLQQDAHDQVFIDRYVQDFDKLQAFIQPYTAEWAAQECGIKKEWIKDFVQEISAARPKVIFHPGWMLSRYNDSFHASRALQILNILMGNIECEGGQIFPKGPGDYGVKSLRSFATQVPKPTAKRGDGVGWKHSHFDKGPGLFHLFYDTMVKEDPYPIKALLTVRHDPLTCFPDPDAQKEALDKLDLLVAIDTHYSEFAWYSDVILPESTYLERDSIIATQKGPKPRFIKRNKCVEPRFETKALHEIIKELAVRLDIGQYFPYNSIEELWSWQLEPTGVTLADFDKKGFVALCDKPEMYDRNALDGKFKTPSGKIEIVSKVLTDAGLESLKPYKSPPAPPAGQFRLVFGRSPIHAHGHTINNPLLNELMPENTLWINRRKAERLGIGNGDWVEVANEGYAGHIRAYATDFIHPEAVYMVHGFGRQVPIQSRAYNAGVADQRLMRGCLQSMDPAGGGLNLCESFVTVTRSARNAKPGDEL